VLHLPRGGGGAPPRGPCVLLSAQRRWALERDTLLVIVIMETVVLVMTLGVPLCRYSGARLLGWGIKRAIMSFDKSLFGAKVNIGEITTSPIEGWVRIANLDVGNPTAHEYLSTYLLRAKEIQVDLDMSVLAKSLGKTIEVEEVTLRGVSVIVEKGRESSNLQDLIDHLQKLAEPDDGQAADAVAVTSATAPKASQVKVILRKLVVKDVGAQIMVPHLFCGARHHIQIADIEETDFHSQYADANGAISMTTMISTVATILLRSIGKSIVANTIGRSTADWLME